MKQRIAIDLDETLGSAIVDSKTIIGFQLRDGCTEILNKLQMRYLLILWSTCRRSYMEKAISFVLRPYFHETYSWDELPDYWKDIRKIHADYLIDDSEHHRERAREYGLENHYLIVPAFGSPEDNDDPRLWLKRIEEKLIVGNGTPVYDKADTTEIIWRWGLQGEEIKHLSDRATEAYEVIGIHGVTAFAGNPPATANVSYARVSDLVTGGFCVYITPWESNPEHRTVRLPRPLTPHTVAEWNKIWKRS